jgi:vitamin B12 transporter
VNLRVPFIAVAFANCIATGAAFAQVQPQNQSLNSLDEVVVVANRMAEPASRVGSSVTVITQADIATSQSLEVADLLERTPGVTVVRNGGLGQPTSVFIRGADSAQTMVLIDGVPVNDPSAPSAGYDFGNLLTGDISRIEILRGAQSTLYGSQAIGGVVSITTAEPASPFGGGASAELGSHATDYMTANLGGKSQGLSWRLAGQYLSTDGISAFDEAFGGKELDASRMSGLSGRVRYEFTPSAELDLRGYYTHARTNFDGFDTPTFTFGDDAEYGTTSQFAEYAGLNFRSLNNQLTNRIAFQYTDYDRRSYDPNVGPVTETFYGIGHNKRYEYQATFQPSVGPQAVLGLQREQTTIETDTPAYDFVPSPLNSEARIDSGYLQLIDEVLRGLTLTGGFRWDRHDVFGTHKTGQGAVAWALNDGATVLRASVGTGFKAPALYQLFSAYGNQSLQPEEATSWDVGIEERVLQRRLTLSATYFSRDSRDLINFFDCSTPQPLCATEPFGYYANIARATARGVELQTSFVPDTAFNISANFTYVDSIDRSPGASSFGNLLPRRPRASGTVSMSYLWTSGLQLSGVLRYSGRSFDDAANTIELSGYEVLDVRVAYDINQHFEIFGRVENATNKHYETAYQYGTPGRGGFVGARVSF